MESIIKELTIPANQVVQGEWIGTGGFGIVHRGKYRDKDVVLKILIDAQDASSRQKLINELYSLWTARHDDIIMMCGFVDEPQRETIVLEFAKYGALGSFLRDLPEHPPLSITVRMVQQLTNAMTFLHHELNPSMLHRDLKADNILVDAEFNAKLSDFGLSEYRATVKFRTSRPVLDDARVNDAGSKSHVPPEKLATPRTKPSKTSDIYSYAITLWEILSRQDVCKHLDELGDFKVEIIDGYRPPDASLRPDCPKELKALIKRCWDREMKKRPYFQDIKSLLEDMTSKLKLTVSQRDRRILQTMADFKDEKETELHCCIYMNNLEKARKLLKDKSSPNSPGQHGLVPLHAAAKYNRPKGIELLLSHGAAIDNQFNSVNQTPLHVAAWNGSVDCIQVLLQKNADVTLVDIMNCTALDLAESKAKALAEQSDDVASDESKELDFKRCVALLQAAYTTQRCHQNIVTVQVYAEDVPKNQVNHVQGKEQAAPLKLPYKLKADQKGRENANLMLMQKPESLEKERTEPKELLQKRNKEDAMQKRCITLESSHVIGAIPDVNFRDVAVASAGAVFVATSQGLREYDSRGQQVSRPLTKGDVLSVDVFSDGRVAAGLTDDSVAVLSCDEAQSSRKWRVTATFKSKVRPRCLAVAQDDSCLSVADGRGWGRGRVLYVYSCSGQLLLEKDLGYIIMRLASSTAAVVVSSLVEREPPLEAYTVEAYSYSGQLLWQRRSSNMACDLCPDPGSGHEYMTVYGMSGVRVLRGEGQQGTEEEDMVSGSEALQRPEHMSMDRQATCLAVISGYSSVTVDRQATCLAVISGYSFVTVFTVARR